MFKGNRIYKIDKNGKKKRVFKIKGLRVKFRGQNSTVILHEPFAKMKKCKIICGNNCTVEIESSCHKQNKLWILCEADNNICKIGKNFSCTNNCIIMLHNETDLSVQIGEDCMFATNVHLRTTDSHAVYDIETNEIQNYGKSVSVGNHCWLASNTIVLKGVNIADNCVIGTNSTVTKDCITPNAIYAGSPAKMIRSGVNWTRQAPNKN